MNTESITRAHGVASHAVLDLSSMTQQSFFDVTNWREEMLQGGRTVVWYSCGVTSAVAAKLALRKYQGKRPVFLDELDPSRGNYEAEEDVECGVLCRSVVQETVCEV